MEECEMQSLNINQNSTKAKVVTDYIEALVHEKANNSSERENG
jgi:hypothetical protein